MNIIDIINKKRVGLELNREELEYAFNGYLKGVVKDYQMSSLLMAICINGMSEKETFDLVDIFIKSGDVLDLSSIPGIKVDKHSTGGIGDKITLNNGNGYYRIELLGYTNSNQDLRKNYYAIVQNGVADSVKPYINSLSVTKSSSTRLSVTTSINENGSGLKNVKYCLSSSTTLTCTPYIILFSYTTYPKSNTLARVSYIDNGSLGNYKKICVNATDANNNTSTYKCVNF